MPRDPLDDLISSFQLGRGIKTILTQQWEHLRKTWVSSEVGLEKNPDDLLPVLDSRYPSLSTLQNLVSQECETEEMAKSCHDAVEKIFLYMANLELYPDLHPLPKLVQMWPIALSQLFMGMLSKHTPIALVVLAYYAALMELKSDHWWLCGWPAKILGRVEEILGPEWNDILQWPKARILATPSPEGSTGLEKTPNS